MASSIKAERFEQLFSNSGVGIFIVDKERKIIEANEAFCKIFGFTYDEIILQSALTLHLSYASYVNFANIAFNKVRNNESLNLEYQFLHKEKKILWLRIAGDSIPNNKEVLWTITDITIQKENEQKICHLNESLSLEVKLQLKKLREKDKQLQFQSRLAQMGEMLSMIAHQWRQPLGAISATTSFLSSKLMLGQVDHAEFEEEIERIETYAAHLSKTIDDFRNFFKPTKQKEEITLESMVDKTLNIAKPLLTNKNITVQTDFTCKETIQTYGNELGQAILNIIKNAEDALLEHTVENPKISIRTYKDDKKVYLEIKDNAGGIDEAIFDKIFEPYFSTKLAKDGTGMGLCMSKTIVEEHCKGHLSVHNEAGCAIFTIALSK
ncbi:MAG: PAS domain S-box protein [Campylobacteraceae bacterium]|nr:PAS domain S-box protein [Campylobacteraceae bacterium]